MKNQYAIFGDKTIIFCTKKDEPYDIIIDTVDLPLVSSIEESWRISQKHHQKNPVVYTFHQGKYLTLKRFIIGEVPEGKFITHKDRDFTNFSRDNLVVADDSERHFYKGVQRNNKTGVRGVSWFKKSESWRVIYKGKGYGFYKNLEVAKKVAELVRNDDFEGNLKDRQYYIDIYKKLDREKLKEANQ